MTDEEINKRVAEIEGWRLFDGVWAHADHCPFTYPHPPPYATDWSWCGLLVEKYGIGVDLARGYSGGAARGWIGWGGGYSPNQRAGLSEDTPQRAICLAVIAAHEGK